MNLFQYVSVHDAKGTPYKIKSVHWQMMQCTVCDTSRVYISESMASSIQSVLSSGSCVLQPALQAVKGYSFTNS